ncbi:MAG: hypothetical protein AAF617_06380 [Bacteroidota bacterium]
MKKQHFKTLKLNKKSISNLDSISGGAPLPFTTFTSILRTCIDFTCGLCAYSGTPCDPVEEP